MTALHDIRDLNVGFAFRRRAEPKAAMMEPAILPRSAGPDRTRPPHGGCDFIPPTRSRAILACIAFSAALVASDAPAQGVELSGAAEMGVIGGTGKTQSLTAMNILMVRSGMWWEQSYLEKCHPDQKAEIAWLIRSRSEIDAMVIRENIDLSRGMHHISWNDSFIYEEVGGPNCPDPKRFDSIVQSRKSWNAQKEDLCFGEYDGKMVCLK